MAATSASAFLTLDSTGNQLLATPVQVSTGAAQAGLVPALNSAGLVDASLLPPGTGYDVIAAITSEVIPTNGFVNIWNNAGVATVRKADSSVAGKAAIGFCPAGAASGAIANITMMRGMMTGLTGLTPGALAFIDPANPGLTTATRPTTSGQSVQRVGTAASASVLEVQVTAAITIG